MRPTFSLMRRKTKAKMRIYNKDAFSMGESLILKIKTIFKYLEQKPWMNLYTIKKFFILTFAKDTPTLKRSYAFTIPLAYHKLEPPQWEELG